MIKFALTAILTAVSWATCTPGCDYTDDPWPNDNTAMGGWDRIKVTYAFKIDDWIKRDIDFSNPCAATRTDLYNWPNYGALPSKNNWNNLMASDDRDEWRFDKDWRTDPYEPYMFVMTHEDAAGKIYASAYILMVIRTWSGYITVTGALVTIRDAHMLAICN